MREPDRIPLIVSAREIDHLIPTAEAARESLDAEVDATPEEQAAFLAAMGRGLGELRRQSQNTDPDVLLTAPDPFASLLQSRMAELAAERQDFEVVESGGAEVRFDTRDLRWARVVFDKLRARKRPQRRPSGDGVEALPNDARIALMSDWGTGLYGAPFVAGSIEDDDERFDVVLHLGDVYYSGTGSEVDDRFLALWPERDDAVRRALNSNHEMYSKGAGYFDRTLPAFEQESSYFALQNDHFTLVCLDTGYDDKDLDDEQLRWVRHTIDGAGDRSVVLFSHHQLFSRFESQGHRLATKLGPLLAAGRVKAWYWGHEHRCVIYEPSPVHGGLQARCLGHGGMPFFRRHLRDFPVETTVGDSLWRRLDGTAEAPSARVLDGPNPHIRDKEDRYLPNGYMVLELENGTLTETVFTADGEAILRQELA